MNLDNSFDIIYKLFKFDVAILDIITEGTVSQISFFLCDFLFLCDLDNYIKKFCKKFPDFRHKTKTKAHIPLEMGFALGTKRK